MWENKLQPNVFRRNKKNAERQIGWSPDRGYVTGENLSTATGAHLNSTGHSLSDMKISIIEQVKKNDDIYQKQREHYHIDKVNTFNRGLNKQK